MSKINVVPIAPAMSRPSRRRDTGLIAVALVLATVLFGHRLIPNVRGLGSMVDSIVPFLGMGIPVLMAIAVLRRSKRAVAAATVPALAWAAMFGGVWLANGGGGTVDLRVASQNMAADNPQPQATVDALAGTDADVIALQEVPEGRWDLVADSLHEEYPYQAIESTVALWSRFPIRQVVGVNTGLAWNRALRAVITLPGGEVVIYVVHLGSARAGDTTTRDHTVEVLGDVLRHEQAERVVLLGDLNTATTDRVIEPLTDVLQDAQAVAGRGPGFTWPTQLPITRPDHVLFRGLTAVSAGVVQTPGSDHRAVVASFRFSR